MSYNRSSKPLLSTKNELNQKGKMLHNYGSVENPISFKFRGVQRERMLLPRLLAVTDFKKFGKKIVCPVIIPGTIIPFIL